MFGNAILPPLTFNSNEEQTGQGASLCNKQTPERGPAREDSSSGFMCLNNVITGANPKTVKGRLLLWGGETAFFPFIKGLVETEETMMIKLY